ncbi:MAG: hypothetical protein P1P82_15225, partial [Bacteroidales bacterium]|nr:hypothetical protein [Bacteroidales bacterium]
KPESMQYHTFRKALPMSSTPGAAACTNLHNYFSNSWKRSEAGVVNIRRSFDIHHSRFLSYG